MDMALLIVTFQLIAGITTSSGGATMQASQKI